MLVAACGEFAHPFSRAVRIMVCMDRERGSLEGLRNAVAGGCKTELFEKDWTTYVPARGRYDSVVICPSRLSSDPGALRRIETVSKHGCACIFACSEGSGDPFADRASKQSCPQVASDDLRAYLEDLGRAPEISVFCSNSEYSDEGRSVPPSFDVVSWTIPSEEP